MRDLAARGGHPRANCHAGAWTSKALPKGGQFTRELIRRTRAEETNYCIAVCVCARATTGHAAALPQPRPALH
jgi:hypothetical protein